jgi:hypothetical protein
MQCEAWFVGWYDAALLALAEFDTPGFVVAACVQHVEAPVEAQLVHDCGLSLGGWRCSHSSALHVDER